MRLKLGPTPFYGRLGMATLLTGSLAGATALLVPPALQRAQARELLAQAETTPANAGAEDAGAPKKLPRQIKPAPSKPTPAKPEAAKPDETAPNGAKPVAPPASLAAAAAAGANTAALNVSAKLTQNGAGTCAATIDAGAAPSMVGVTESNTVSLWSNVEPRDRHAASVFIGQRYGTNPAVPYGVTGVIASPTPSGSCDLTVVQVVSSPLPCAKVRETLARGGRVLGELAGLPLMQSADGQTLLMPTATNTCVLVGFNAKFGN